MLDMKKIMIRNFFEYCTVAIIECVVTLGYGFFNLRLEAEGGGSKGGLSECEHLYLNITNLRDDLGSFQFSFHPSSIVFTVIYE